MIENLIHRVQVIEKELDKRVLEEIEEDIDLPHYVDLALKNAKGEIVASKSYLGSWSVPAGGDVDLLHKADSAPAIFWLTRIEGLTLVKTPFKRPGGISGGDT